MQVIYWLTPIVQRDDESWSNSQCHVFLFSLDIDTLPPSHSTHPHILTLLATYSSSRDETSRRGSNAEANPSLWGSTIGWRQYPPWPRQLQGLQVSLIPNSSIHYPAYSHSHSNSILIPTIQHIFLLDSSTLSHISILFQYPQFIPTYFHSNLVSTLHSSIFPFHSRIHSPLPLISIPF